MIRPTQPLLLTPMEAAATLGRSVDQLRRWRARGRGPEFFDLDRGLVRYSRVAVEATAKELRLRQEQAIRDAGTG